MPRIAYLTPMPPARTGIATYSAQVLASLKEIGFRKRHDIEVLWPLDPRVDETVVSADLAVYHVGNNAEFHGEIYRLAVRHPGLVVLHDLAIDDLVRWFRDTGDPLGSRATAEAEPARLSLYETRPDIAGPLETPWCAHILRRARGVIVHSAFGADYVRATGSRTPVFVVPHPVIAPPRAARTAPKRARDLREGMRETFLVGILGDIGGAKGIDAILEAVAAMGGDVRVAIVGRRIPGYDVEGAIEASRMTGRVTVASDVSERDFYTWLHASEAVVNLRHPHRGEVSGTLVRAMAAGKPVIVQAVGTYLDHPDDSVMRIPGGDPDPSELGEVLTRLRDDADLRRTVGERAAQETERLRAEQATAHGYEEAIEATLRLLGDPVRWATARWASALSPAVSTERDGELALPHLERLRELAQVPTGVEWAGSSGRYGGPAQRG
jgi:glycosyltransferase involved in cell wall biosynthesis